MKQAIRKSNIKLAKTHTGKLADSFGFDGRGDSYIRRDSDAILQEQKANGLAPISFDPATGKIKQL